MADLIDHRFYGRRKGRRMRVRQQQDFNQLLPKFSFNLPESSFCNPKLFFSRPTKDIWLEIGFGYGEHLAILAECNPDIGFIGCEVFENGIGHLLSAIAEKNMENIRIFPQPAQPLLQRLPDQSIGRIFLLFPDPWPKKRHARRRFVQPETIEILGRILKEGGELRMASDDPGLITWITEHMMRSQDFRWLADSAGDWLARPADWPSSRYEEKAINKGIQPVYWRFERSSRI